MQKKTSRRGRLGLFVRLDPGTTVPPAQVRAKEKKQPEINGARNSMMFIPVDRWL